MPYASKRLIGTLRIFRANIRNGEKLFVASYWHIDEDRKILVRTLNTLLGQARITRTSFQAVVDELKEKRIYLNKPPLELSKKNVKGYRDFRIREYEVAGQFALDQGVVSLATNFEELIRRTLIKFYSDDPRRLSKDKEIKLGDLVGKTSLHNVYEEISEKVVKDLLYGSANNWFDTLQNKLNFDLQPYSKEIGTIEELYLVRNCIVHNAKFASRELLTKAPKYIGHKKINPTYKDYLRFKRATLKVANVIFDQYNEKYAKKYLSARQAIKEIKELHKEIEEATGDNIVLSLKRDEINKLVPKYINVELDELRELLLNDIFEAKLLAAKVLAQKYKKAPNGAERQKIFLFCILNLELFNDRELIQILVRNVVTGPRLVNHNIQLLKSLSYFSDPLKAYFLLKLIERHPDLTSKRHLSWIVDNIERHALRHAQSSSRLDYLKLAKRKAISALSTIPD